MKLSRIFLGFFLFLAFAFGLSKDEIKPYFQLELENITAILNNQNLSSQAKNQAVFKIMDKYFDYKQMAEISLGKKYYDSLKPKEQLEFNKVFEKNLKDSFVEKLKMYNNQTIKIVNTSEPNPKRYILETKILSGKDSYDVNYKFFPNKKNDWKIYDVDILGVSVVMTYKNQFKEVIKKGNFAALMDKLKSIDLNKEIQ